MSRACRWGRGRIPTTSAARSSGSIAKTGESKTLYTECDGHKLSRAQRPGVRQAGRLLLHRSRQAPRPPSRPWRRSTTRCPTARRSSCSPIRMLSPNGCGLSPDGKMLYVADTEGARLWAFDIEGPGVLRKPKADFAPHSGRRDRRRSPGRRASTAWRCWPTAISAWRRSPPARSPSSRRPARSCARSRCRTSIRPTSASAARTCGRPTSRCPTRASSGVMQWPEPG